MDYRLRLFENSIINIINDFADLPLEARRLVLELSMYKVEKKADEAVVSQHNAMEEENAETIFEDKLGELPEQCDTAE